MTIQVKSYSKHMNGKLVTVHGYATERSYSAPSSNPNAPQHATRQFVNRTAGTNISPPGMYMNPQDLPPAAGQGGLTPYTAMPGGRLTKEPIVKWRRTILPKRGAYKIPRMN